MMLNKFLCFMLFVAVFSFDRSKPQWVLNCVGAFNQEKCSVKLSSHGVWIRTKDCARLRCFNCGAFVMSLKINLQSFLTSFVSHYR